MALATDDAIYVFDSAFSWKSSGGGGDAVLDHGGAFADGQAYMGEGRDLGAEVYPFYAWFLKIDTGGVAPLAGTIAEVRVGTNPSVTATPTAGMWTGGVTGSAAQYKSAEEDEWAAQLIPVGALVHTNDANLNAVQQISGLWTPPARHIAPVLINRSGQTAGAAADLDLMMVGVILRPKA